MALKNFYETQDVYISHDEAWRTLVWFFGGNAGSMPSTLTYNDRSFAQALIFEAVIASRKIGYIKSLWESTVKPPEAVGKFLKEIAKITAKALWESLKPVDLKDPEIYSMVKNTLTRSWRSAWQIRVETGEDVY